MGLPLTAPVSVPSEERIHEEDEASLRRKLFVYGLPVHAGVEAGFMVFLLEVYVMTAGMHPKAEAARLRP